MLWKRSSGGREELFASFGKQSEGRFGLLFLRFDLGTKTKDARVIGLMLCYWMGGSDFSDSERCLTEAYAV